MYLKYSIAVLCNKSVSILMKFFGGIVSDEFCRRTPQIPSRKALYNLLYEYIFFIFRILSIAVSIDG